MTQATTPLIELADYHAHPAWSASRLKFAATNTGRAYWARYEDPLRVPTPPTDAMRQGSLCDCVITQPDKAHERYCVMPADAPRRPTAKQLTDGQDSKPGTKARDAWQEAQDREAWWQQFTADLGSREIISPDWWTRAETIRDVLMADPEVGAMLRAAMLTSQTPHAWVDDMGRECRYLPDLETASGGLWDLKKAASANPRRVIAQSYQLAYDIQLEHYGIGFADRYGQRPVEAGLICYEWDAPHDYVVMPATPELLALGSQRREAVIQQIEAWRAAGDWPSHGRHPLDPPAWMNDSSGGEGGLSPESITLF
jgi:hypothetical protein